MVDGILRPASGILSKLGGRRNDGVIWYWRPFIRMIPKEEVGEKLEALLHLLPRR